MSAISHVLASHILASLIAVVIAQASAQAQNLDQDKTGPKLFAASCVDCHRSARGLAKGRMSLMLSLYLRQHYTSSFSSAQTLTAYLQSVDTPRAKPQPGKSPPPATKSAATNTSALRPPALVPGR
jgi:hypothetical protein